MAAPAASHPPVAVLHALGAGKLDYAAVEPVLAHLETCADCQTQLRTLSGGDFLARFRATGGRAGADAATQSWPGVLPELHNHPQYEVLRELGRGGMGVVYLARNKPMQREEVLKVVNKQRLGQDGGAERFLREIRSAAKLNHPNIVIAYSALKLDDLLVLAMEYVVGEDLAKVVRVNGPLPVPNACCYIQQAALGLQHASEKGMIHRDIKPGNLILARGGKKHIVKILDFGLAKATREEGATHDLTGDNKALGTPAYIAPEQAMDAARADIRADIYSLGCTLYYLLTGHAPFNAPSVCELLQAHISTDATPVHVRRPGVPAQLSAMIAKMMAKDPVRRYQTPAEIARALAPFTKDGVEPLPDETAAPGTDPWATVITADVNQGIRADAAIRGRRQNTVVEQPALPAVLSPHVTAHRPLAAIGGAKLLIGLGIGAAALLILVLGMALAAGAMFLLGTDRTVLMEELPPEPVRPPTPAKAAEKAGPAKAPLVPDGFVSLFNGTDLTGWKTQPNDRAIWKVDNDGILVGTGEVGHLFHIAKTYSNFHLWVRATINSRGDSGVYFRTRFGATTPQGWLTDGYEAQINVGSTVPHKTGSLSKGLQTVVNRQESPVKANQWFNLDVIADGPHIIVKVNGAVTADYIDATLSPRSGNIAIQVAGTGAVVQVRGIGIKELPPGEGRLIWPHPAGKFEQVNGRVWLEQIKNNAWWFSEVRRTADFVELHRPGAPGDPFRNCLVHLHRDVAWIQFDSRKWTKFYDGAWSCLPSAPVASLDSTIWNGSETLANYGKLRFEFPGGDRATMIDQHGKMDGRYVQNGAAITLRFGPCVYTGSVNGQRMSGVATNSKQRWNWTVSRD